jgi:putative ABC transporter, permease protein
MTKTSVRPIRPVWHEWDLIRAFGQRDLKSKFNGTLLGWLWSLVVPLASLGIYTLIFGGLFKMVPTEIASRHQGIGIFAVWLFAGLTIWGFFQNSINAGINGLMGSGSLLQKVYFPAYSAVLGSCLAIGVQSAVEVGLLLIVLALLANVSWTWLLLVPFLVLLIVFTGAVSVIVSIWNIYVRDLAHLVGVFLQLAFYATPIIYNPDIVPDTVWGLPAHALVEAMPMAEFIELFRSLVYSLRPGDPGDWLACCAWSLAAFAVAVWVFRRWGADLGERI